MPQTDALAAISLLSTIATSLLSIAATSLLNVVATLLLLSPAAMLLHDVVQRYCSALLRCHCLMLPQLALLNIIAMSLLNVVTSTLGMLSNITALTLQHCCPALFQCRDHAPQHCRNVAAQPPAGFSTRLDISLIKLFSSLTLRITAVTSLRRDHSPRRRSRPPEDSLRS